MAIGIKIPALPAATTIHLTDFFIIDDNITTSHITAQQLSTFINANIPNLTGDVTSINFVTTISNNAVTTLKILNSAVTYAKIQNVSAISLLGNPTGLSATVQEITLGATLSFVGSALQTLALTGDVTTSANSFVTAISNNAVTTAKINNAAVTYAKIQNETASTILGNPTGLSASPSEITLGATLAFLASSLQTVALTGDVTSTANSFVTTIANNAITTSKINNAAVTYAKIQNESASTLLGNPTGLSASPSEITLGATFTFSGSTLQTVAHSGDITSAANSFILTINNAAVTYAKIQNVSASRLLGNPTGGAASASEISLGSTLAFSGSALQTGAFTGDVTAAANSFITTIAANAVTFAKFQQIAANSFVGNPTGALANVQAITLGATLSFVATALQTVAMTGDVTTSANSFVTTIANNAVTTVKINNAAVTYAKIQNESASTLLGNPTGGATSPSEITIGATMAFVASALQTVAMTGDVTTSANSFATTIANNAVTTAKINNAAVTYAKIQNVTANRLLGNPTGGAAAPSEIALNANFSFISNTLISDGYTNVAMFTTPGANTFNVPSMTRKALFELWGAGGGGGGALLGGSRGAGGGAGGRCRALASITPGGTITVTIGTGGTAGSTAGGAGGNGGNTTASGGGLAATLNANGGQGGGGSTGATLTTPVIGGLGGTASNGDLNMSGMYGENGLPTVVSGGGGGSGAGQGTAAGTGNNAITNGAGGGGGAGLVTAGGTGGNGMGVIYYN